MMKRNYNRSWSAAAYNQKGQILIVFAVSIIVLLGLVGLSIDVGIAYSVRAKLNAAVDAASIAASRAVATGETEAARRQNAIRAGQRFFYANFPDGYLGAIPDEPTITVEYASNGVWRTEVEASADMELYFFKLFGHETMTVAAMGEAIRRDLDLILVIDTSGSLDYPVSPRGTFQKVKDAAVSFVDRFIGGSGGDRLGLIAFSGGASLEAEINKTSVRGFDKDSVINKINSLSVGGPTAGAEAMRIAQQEIDAVPSAIRSSLRVVVFFSDGAPNMVAADYPLGYFDRRNNWYWSGNSQTGTLYTDSSRSSTWPDQLWRHDSRNSKIGDFENQIRLLPLTGLGEQDLRSFNNQRTLSAATTISGVTGYPNSSCNVNKAARNMVENIANDLREDQIYVFTLGLGSMLNRLEVTYCGYGQSEYGGNILKRMANTSDVDTFNSDQPRGLYVYAENADELEEAFAAIASEIIRLTR